MMKKKKRDHNINGITIRRRHRHHHHLLHHHYPLFNLLYAFSCCILLLFVAFPFFSSPPPVIGHSSMSEDEGTVGSTSDTETVFRVPESRVNTGHDLWRSRLSNFYFGCSNATDNFLTADVKTHDNRYLLIATSGGLNQQRTGITDAVVAAYILNATLVVPKLDQKSFWKDSSDFAQIFDVDWFISFLANDVRIIKQLPMKGGKIVAPHHMRVPRKCTPKCYQNHVLPLFSKKHAIQLGKFDYRLSNRLVIDLQKLRCRVNYHALRFTNSILGMGKKLVERMRMKSKLFIALHLRFEPDMLAFSGCDYGGGEKERTELGAIRKRWKTLHEKNPEKERRQGRCPLSPEEVGLMLRALGFGSDVHIYVASGEVYGGEETLAPLKALFPNFYSKDTLASKDELAPFSSFSSRMAALDFSVCDESDVFVTNNNGNMAKILAGRRRYFGHKPTIRPNSKKLYKLFLNQHNMTWEEFASKVRTHQIGFMGEPNEVKPGRGEFHENPSSCICENSEAKAGEDPVNQSEVWREKKRIVSDERLTDYDHEQDVSDMDYVEYGNDALEKGDSFRSTLPKMDPPELEELVSD